MHDIALIDETLDLNLTSTYHLSIQISLDGFSFSILDTIRNKYIVLKHINLKGILHPFSLSEELTKYLDEDELLNADFKSVKCIYLSQKSTLVPSPLFKDENLSLYFQFNHQVDKSESLHHYKLKNSDTNIIYAIPECIEQSLKSKYSNIKFYHQGCPLIEDILLNHKNKENTCKVFVNVSQEFFDIATIKGSSLILFNSFHYKNEKDLIYFILNIYEQLKLNPETTEIILSGDINKNNSNYNMVKRFIRHIKFEKLNNSYGYSYTFNDIPSHSFVNLLNLSKCE